MILFAPGELLRLRIFAFVFVDHVAVAMVFVMLACSGFASDDLVAFGRDAPCWACLALKFRLCPLRVEAATGKPICADDAGGVEFVREFFVGFAPFVVHLVDVEGGEVALVLFFGHHLPPFLNPRRWRASAIILRVCSRSSSGISRHAPL